MLFQTCLSTVFCLDCSVQSVFSELFVWTVISYVCTLLSRLFCPDRIALTVLSEVICFEMFCLVCFFCSVYFFSGIDCWVWFVQSVLSDCYVWIVLSIVYRNEPVVNQTEESSEFVSKLDRTTIKLYLWLSYCINISFPVWFH